MSDRPATISPSQIKRLMPKNGLGKGAATYADEIVMRLMGVELDDYTSYEMQWGNDNEPKAITAYERQTFTEVTLKDRFYHPKYDFVSGEPDGLVGENGLIEIKCPKCKYHLLNYLHGEQIDKYIYQMQGYLWILDRDWVDFLSFDPRFPDDMQLAVHRIERDQEMIDLIEERCVEFWETMVRPKAQEIGLGVLV